LMCIEYLTAIYSVTMTSNIRNESNIRSISTPANGSFPCSETMIRRRRAHTSGIERDWALN
jgi:hypothetical protein